MAEVHEVLADDKPNFFRALWEEFQAQERFTKLFIIFTILISISTAALAGVSLTLRNFAETPTTPSITVNVNDTLKDNSGNNLEFNKMILGNNTLGFYRQDTVKNGTTTSDGGTYISKGSGVWDPANKNSVQTLVDFAKDAGVSVVRWPGGCAVHNFDWKKTIGPIANRQKIGDTPQGFGLPEFLQNTENIGALPLITISDFTGTAQDAADLVEYLNSPADANHPWALKRAADGHPAPWNVKWFEYGNETFHNNHVRDLYVAFDKNNNNQRVLITAGEFYRGNGRYVRDQILAPDYAARYKAYQQAMRSVDPTIQLGVVMSAKKIGSSDWETRLWDSWNKEILTDLQNSGTHIDFLVAHNYLPSVQTENLAPNPLFTTAFGAGQQLQRNMSDLENLAVSVTGSTLPIAATEFNGGFVQNTPVRYRYSLGNALIVGDMLKTLATDKNIVMANFWQFANSYYGMVFTRGNQQVKRPDYYPFYLYHNHFGSIMLNAVNTSPEYNITGAYSISSMNIPYLSVVASKDPDNKKLYLMVINKNLDNPMMTKIQVNGAYVKSAKTWILNGPTVDSTNETNQNDVTVSENDLGNVENGFNVVLPAHSMTALEISLSDAPTLTPTSNLSPTLTSTLTPTSTVTPTSTSTPTLTPTPTATPTPTSTPTIEQSQNENVQGGNYSEVNPEVNNMNMSLSSEEQEAFPTATPTISQPQVLKSLPTAVTTPTPTPASEAPQTPQGSSEKNYNPLPTNFSLPEVNTQPSVASKQTPFLESVLNAILKANNAVSSLVNNFFLNILKSFSLPHPKSVYENSGL